MISIIVPVYNTEKYLGKCIDSILSQSYNIFELLLIDDGSTDASGQICDDYCRKDHRIRVFHQENGGVSAARNQGLKECIGDWILFVDADDELYEDSLENLLNNLCSQKDLIVGGFRKYSEFDKIVYENSNQICVDINANEMIRMMYKPVYSCYDGYLWNKLFRRDIIENNSISFEEKIYFNEDRLFIVNYLVHCKGQIKYDTTPVYKYYEREGVGAMASLQKGFNYNFVTDFDAFVLMYYCIKQNTKDKKLIDVSRHGIVSSYFRIKRMMNDFGIKDVRLMCHFIYQMLITGCYWYRLNQKFFQIKTHK